MLPIFLFIYLLLPQTPSETWQRINTDQGISFLFPNHAQKLEKKTGDITSYIYQTKTEHCVLGIVCTEMSKNEVALTPMNALKVYKELRIGSLSMETAILKNEITIPDDKLFIQEIEYSIIKDSYEMTYFKRFIFNENMIYQISIGGRSRIREYLLEKKEIFFNSIYFTE